MDEREYTVELEARPLYADFATIMERYVGGNFYDTIEADQRFMGAVVSVGLTTIRVMGQIKADDANSALGYGKAAFRRALKKLFDDDELEWTTIAVTEYDPDKPVESIPTPV